MKYSLFPCIAILLIVFSWSPIMAADKGKTYTSPNYENNPVDTQAIRAVINGTWSALQKQDINLFYKYCSRDWMLYTARGKKLTANKLFEIHKAKVKNFNLIPSQMNIRILGNIGWATYDSKMSGQINGKPWGGNFIFTNIFKKNNDKWECIHMHESKHDK
jgi:ketosteroid isomerase-like protein